MPLNVILSPTRSQFEDPDPLINIVTIHADPAGYSTNDITDDDSATVDLKKPGIEVKKQVWDSNNSIWTNETIAAGVGALLQFKITITNTGEVPLTNIIITDELSSHFKYRDNANIPPTSVSGDLRLITWTIPQVPVGGTISITYYAETTHVCLGRNTVSVVTNQRVSDTDTINVKTLPNHPAILQLDMKVWANFDWVDEITTYLGRTLTFKITITNSAATPLTNVEVTNNLSDNLVYSNNANITPSSTSDHKVTWHFASINSGESIEITYTAKTIGLRMG